MPSGMRDLKTKLNRRLEALRQDRHQHLAKWYDVKNYILPNNGRGLTDAEDEQEDKKPADTTFIYDSTATRALAVAAAGFQAGITSPSRPWFKLGFEDPALMRRPQVERWLFETEQMMSNILAKSTFYAAAHQLYMEYLGFGTGPIGIFENFERVIHCRTLTAGEYFIANNALGNVDVLYRTFWKTAVQLIEEFGAENCSRSVNNAVDNGGTETRFLVVQAIEPNDDRFQIPGIPGSKKFRSVYYEKKGDDDKVLSVNGYVEFPYMVPRWERVGNSPYGHGIGHQILPDVKQLQKETLIKLEILDQLTHPALLAPGRPNDLQINSFPRGITYDTTPGAQAGHGVRPLFEMRPDLPSLLNDIQNLRDQIQRGSFNDLFLALTNDAPSHQMTAREVAERHEEKMLQVGPALEHTETEFLNPGISRIFEIMNRAGLLAPPPEEIQGQDLKVKYTSVFAQAQQMIGIGAMQQFSAFVGQIAAVKPDVLDKVDFDEAVDIFGDRAGVPPTMIVPEEDVLKVRANRAQQQRQQQMAAMAKPIADLAKAGKDASQIPGVPEAMGAGSSGPGAVGLPPVSPSAQGGSVLAGPPGGTGAGLAQLLGQMGGR